MDLGTEIARLFEGTHLSFSGEDQGFPVGGGANPRGRQHMILPNFAKNCIKLRKFWAVGRPRSATVSLIKRA